MSSAATTTGLESDLRRRLERKPLLLMTHLVVGYPSLEANLTMLEAMDAAGVDLVELQLPFSEPIADGPTFVQANQAAIRAGTSWHDYFRLAALAAERFSFHTLFMGYANSIVRMGIDTFSDRVAGAGQRGFIVPDLPLEESAELRAAARGRGLDQILTMAPTNTQERLDELGRHASGLVYCTARQGVTGRRTDLSDGVTEFLARCRAVTTVPLGLGFGITTADDVRALRGLADVAIVGTAGLRAWQDRGPDGYAAYVTGLAAATL